MIIHTNAKILNETKVSFKKLFFPTTNNEKSFLRYEIPSILPRYLTCNYIVNIETIYYLLYETHENIFGIYLTL